MPIGKSLRYMVLGAAMVVHGGIGVEAEAADTIDLTAVNASGQQTEGHLHQGADLAINQSIVVERYPSGKVKTERQVALDADGNFVNHGEFRAFSEEGRLIGAGTYNYGQREGEWAREFHTRDAQVISENAKEGFVGPFTSTATFHNGKLNGEWTVTDSKSKPLVLWQFADNIRHGQAIWFNADGSTRKQLQYKNDQVVSNMIATGKDELQVVAEYVDGRELVREISRFTDDSKKIKSEGYVLKPRETTRTTIDWWEGRIDLAVIAKEGSRDRHGEWRFWHENGNLEMTGSYERGQETGRFTWWHENGQKAAEGDYVAGRMEGAWQTWYSNGARKSAGKYAMGKREGVWLSWHENGMPKLQANYTDGTMIADARKWDESGRLIAGQQAIAQMDSFDDQDLRLSQKPDGEGTTSESETR